VHNADKIIVLDKGRVVEMGKHQELIKNEKLYHTLYTMRMLEPQTPPPEEALGVTPHGVN
jgi:ABC-type dipeptide/oligopeptide/nickel transport system ATPase component